VCAAALGALATVSEQQAVDAATAAVTGTPGQVSLGDENGYVVWEVEVTQADGTVTEVKVDAGDGTVLAQEAGEQEGAEGQEDGAGNG